MQLPEDIRVVDNSFPSETMEFSSGIFRDRIDFYFKLDTWTIEQACFMLIGVLPEKFFPIGFPKLNGSIIKQDERTNLQEKGDDIRQLWESNVDHKDFASPKYFIDWAVKKNIDIPWIKYASENGYYQLENKKIIPENSEPNLGIIKVDLQINMKKKRQQYLDGNRLRGAKRRIVENWDMIENLHGRTVDGTKVLRILNRETDSPLVSLKTVQNHLSGLRNEGLIP